MSRYIYPQNLKATASLWLWGLRDFVILCISALLAAVALVQLHWVAPLALTLCFGFLTIRHDESTIMDYLRWAIRYFLTTQQMFYWR